MPPFDPDAMVRIAGEAPIVMVGQVHGAQGVSTFKALLVAIRSIYRYLAPDMHNNQIVIFKTLNDVDRPLPQTDALVIESLGSLVQQVQGPCVIQTLDNGQLLLWNNLTPDVRPLAAEAVVYLYRDRAEYFYSGSEVRLFDKVVPAAASSFAIPTFSDLLDALNHYKSHVARYSTCPILSQIWRDNCRVFLKNGQEEMMRDSLTLSLRASLRGDLEVRPEQNVDESHPVDIKVTWSGPRHLALIEIKWLGKPKYDDGHLGTMYSDARARSGARQLADYLDSNRDHAPIHATKGYLVLIDARRRGLTPQTTEIDVHNGLYYADREVSFNPAYYELRSDFERPIRMFVEPICRLP